MTREALEIAAARVGNVQTKIEALAAEVGALKGQIADAIADLPTEPPPPPPPPQAWPCANPHMGPVRRSTDKVLILLRPTSDSPLRAFSAIENLVTPAVYAPPGVHQLDGVYDHSDAGIEKHAQRLWDHWLSRRDNGNLLWWDPENGTSINVPASVGYKAADHKEWAACYFYNTDERFRKEAVRFQSGVAKRVIAKAKAAGVTKFEMGHYNCPRLPLFGAQNSTSVYEMQVKDTLADLLCPYFAFGGPSAYFSGTPEEMASGADRFIDHRANVVRRMKAAFGDRQKIVPAIWARWFSLGSKGPYPGGTWVLPAGYLGRMAKALLDAGADGLLIWRSSADDDDGPDAGSAGDGPQFSERYQEVVEVVRKHGGFARAT
jgi:hypothetical protein